MGEKRELAGGKEEQFKKDNYFREEEKKPGIREKEYTGRIKACRGMERGFRRKGVLRKRRIFGQTGRSRAGMIVFRRAATTRLSGAGSWKESGRKRKEREGSCRRRKTGRQKQGITIGSGYLTRKPGKGNLS